MSVQILLNHTPADRVVEVLVLVKRSFCEFLIAVLQPLVKRSDKLHPANSSEQVGGGLVDGLILRLQSNNVVSRDQLDVLALSVGIDFTHQIDELRLEWLFESLNRLQEHHILVAGPAFNILAIRLEARVLASVQALPFRRESVACVYH